MGCARCHGLIRRQVSSAVLCSSGITCILCRESAEGRPIELGAAVLTQEAQESVVEQAAKRHRHAQALGRRQREANVLESERRGEARGVEFAFGDQATVGLVERGGEEGGREQLLMAVVGWVVVSILPWFMAWSWLSLPGGGGDRE